MPRSVVLAGTDRCGHCLVPPRWCICHALPPVDCPVPVGILLHRRERWRPSSTGRLIERVCPAARAIQFHPSLARGEILEPGNDRRLWILHPRGEPMDREAARGCDPGGIQLLLLDGSWTEAGRMLRVVERWGRPVRLSLPGSSRYWLRNQSGEGSVSTVEALLGFLSVLGLTEAEARLRLHFELQVYVSLRARGRKEDAAAYLASSPVAAALPDFLARLQERRPNPSLPAAERKRASGGDSAAGRMAGQPVLPKDEE